MARIVYVTSGLVGILNSGLALAGRLRDAGHDVVFVGWRDNRDQVERQGFGFERIDADERARDRLRGGGVRSLLAAPRLRRELAGSTEIEETVRRLEPDLLIIDVEVHTAVIAAMNLDVPFVTRFDFLSVYRTWDLPPLHTDLDVPTSRSERLRCRAAWITMLVRRAVNDTIGQLRPSRAAARFKPFRYGTVSRHQLVRFARARGVSLRGQTSRSHWLAPHVYPSIPMITTTPAELEFPGPRHPTLHYVGPMIHTADTRVSDDDRQRWDSFRASAHERGLPIVYCSLGTLGRNVVDQVRNVVAASAASADWALVVGLGGESATVGLGEIPADVLVLEYAPQVDVLASAAAAVVHGGINTINECLWYEVPMVVHRTGRVDQPGNASRVEHHGLGVRVDLDAGAAEVGAAIRRVLNDRGYAERVAAMRATLDRYEGVVEQLVEQLLDTTGRP